MNSPFRPRNNFFMEMTTTMFYDVVGGEEVEYERSYDADLFRRNKFTIY